MKSTGVDSFAAPIDTETSIAILQAAQSAGQKIKVPVLATGYGQTLLDQPQAVSSAQGAYFDVGQVPVELHTPATIAEQAALKQYAGFTGVPGFDYQEGWISADLLVKGLEVAGTNPTRASFISNLRQVTNYTAGGLLAQPTKFRDVHSDSASAVRLLRAVRRQRIHRLDTEAGLRWHRSLNGLPMTPSLGTSGLTSMFVRSRVRLRSIGLRYGYGDTVNSKHRRSITWTRSILLTPSLSTLM